MKTAVNEETGEVLYQLPTGEWTSQAPQTDQMSMARESSIGGLIDAQQEAKKQAEINKQISDYVNTEYLTNDLVPNPVEAGWIKFGATAANVRDKLPEFMTGISADEAEAEAIRRKMEMQFLGKAQPAGTFAGDFVPSMVATMAPGGLPAQAAASALYTGTTAPYGESVDNAISGGLWSLGGGLAANAVGSVAVPGANAVLRASANSVDDVAGRVAGVLPNRGAQIIAAMRAQTDDYIKKYKMEKSQAGQMLEQNGLESTLAIDSGHPGIASLEQGMRKNPTGAAYFGDKVEKNLELYHKTVAKSIGLDEGAAYKGTIPADEIDNAFNRVGKVYEDLTQKLNGNIQFDPRVSADIQSLLPELTSKRLRARGRYTGLESGQLTPQEFFQTRADLNALARNPNKLAVDREDALQAINALDDAVAPVLGEEYKIIYDQTRQQYRNLLAVEAARNPTSGRVSPVMLSSRLNKNYNRQYSANQRPESLFPETQELMGMTKALAHPEARIVAQPPLSGSPTGEAANVRGIWGAIKETGKGDFSAIPDLLFEGSYGKIYKHLSEKHPELVRDFVEGKLSEKTLRRVMKGGSTGGQFRFYENQQSED